MSPRKARTGILWGHGHSFWSLACSPPLSCPRGSAAPGSGLVCFLGACRRLKWPGLGEDEPGARGLWGPPHRCFVTSVDSLSPFLAGGPGLSVLGESGKPWRWWESWPHASPASSSEDRRGSRASESLPSSVSLPNFLGGMRHRLHY